eukprot:4078142-Amphidinium_carterae.1
MVEDSPWSNSKPDAGLAPFFHTRCKHLAFITALHTCKPEGFAVRCLQAIWLQTASSKSMVPDGLSSSKRYFNLAL